MGLTASSCGSNLLDDEVLELQKNCDYTIAIARKSECWKKHYF